MKLSHLALTNADVLELLRNYELAPIIRYVVGTQILEQIWKSQGDLRDQKTFSLFFERLEPEEQTSLGQLLTRPELTDAVTEAHYSLQILEFRRAQRELHQLKLTLANSKLSSKEMVTLNEKYQNLLKEVRERRSRLPQILP